MDLGKGVPCYRTASAMAKRQDLSLVCLGNNQEVAGTGEDGKLGQRLGPKVPVGGHMRPQGAAQWLPPLCASHIRPRPPVTHQHRPYENRARPALGGGKVNSSGKRAAQPPRPRRVTGGQMPRTRKSAEPRDACTSSQTREKERECPRRRGQAPRHGKPAVSVVAARPGRAVPAVHPGPRHAPGRRAHLHTGAGPGPWRRVPRRGATVRLGTA